MDTSNQILRSSSDHDLDLYSTLSTDWVVIVGVLSIELSIEYDWVWVLSIEYDYDYEYWVLNIEYWILSIEYEYEYEYSK